MPRSRYAAALLASAFAPVLAHAAPQLKTLYSFQGFADGVYPYGSLIPVGHVLYGATAGGNVPHCVDGPLFGCGLLFALDLTTGKETVAHRFDGGPDGKYPAAAPVYEGGVIYGSTSGGGAANSGVLYSFNPATGVEAVLLSFSPQTGIGPLFGLTWFQNSLYGTGSNDAFKEYGAIFKYDLTHGAQSLVYGFKGGADGSYPESGAVSRNGLLFGTTAMGGQGSGTVFTINTRTGHHKVIYDFPDNQYPIEPTSLIAVGDGFYGTTWQGGAGYGSVFKITRKGVESQVYGFKGGTDGAYPIGLVFANGSLYGTTQWGGGGNCLGISGCGTVFKIDLATGTETVLHAFAGGADGMTPSGVLTHYGNAWYGTTGGGGRDSVTCTFPYEADVGCGTVFKLTE